MHRSSGTPAAMVLLVLALVAAACGSASSSAPPKEPPTSGATADEPGSGDRIDESTRIAAVLDDISAALDEQANRWWEAEFEWAHWGFDLGVLPPGPNFWYRCTRMEESLAAVLAVMPERLDDNELDGTYEPWRASVSEYLTQVQSTCEAVDERGRPSELTDEDVDAHLVALEPVAEREQLACFDFLKVATEYGPLNCTRTHDEDGDFSLAPPGAEIYELLDLEPPPPPTPFSNDGEPSGCPLLVTYGFDGETVGPGMVECSWFARPFVLNHPEKLYINTANEVVSFRAFPRGEAFLDIWAVAEITSPDALHPVRPESFWPVEDGLAPWLAELPVEILESETYEINGNAATRWILTGDEDEIRARTGGEQRFVWIFSIEAQHSLGIQGGVLGLPLDMSEDDPNRPFFTEPWVYAIWEIETPTGPVIAHVQTLTEFTTELEFAESVLASITWVG